MTPEEWAARYSRFAIPLYLVVAGINVAAFLFISHDVNYIAIALLMLVLIMNQKGVDAWREAAQAWRRAAENAQDWRRFHDR